MSSKMPQCPRCEGRLVVYDYEIYCLNCGYRHHEALKPSPHRTPTTLKNASTLARPAPESSQVSPPEESCVQAAYKVLNQLNTPFMCKIDNAGLLGMTPLPCFFFTREYKASKAVFEKSGPAMHRWEEIRKKIEGFPDQMRRDVWLCLRKCDSRMREAAEACDRDIQQFLDLITHEQKRLVALRKAACQSTLFRFSLHDSLLRYCDDVQKQLDSARGIVQDARKRLEPAKTFFLSQRSPTREEAKKTLLLICMKRPSIDKKKAAELVSTLLNLADPKRPTKPGAIRQLGYRRYRPDS